MEQAIMTTDNLRNTMATVDAMKAANKEMTKQYGKINISEIEVSPPSILISSLFKKRRRERLNGFWKCFEQAISYDMEDLIEQANEVQESLGRSYGVPDEVNEDELQAGRFFSIDDHPS